MVDEGVNVHALSWIVGVKGVVIAVVGVIHDQAAVVGKENKAKGVHAVHIHAILKPVVNLHAEHKTVKRREKKGRNVERLNISGFRV